MARVQMPLLSLEAHGNVTNNSIQYRTDRNGKAHAYRPRPPAELNQANPSTQQAERRAAFQEASTQWRQLAQTDKSAWQHSAKRAGFRSGWHMFLAEALAPSIYPADTLTTSAGDPILEAGGQIIRIN